MTCESRLRVIEVWHALIYGDTDVVRLFMAARLTLWAVLAMLVPPSDLIDSRYLHALTDVQPRYVWVGASATLAFMHWWRIFGRPAQLWSAITHALTAGWWGMLVVANVHTLGFLSPSTAPETVLVIVSLWLAARVSYTAADRAKA